MSDLTGYSHDELTTMLTRIREIETTTTNDYIHTITGCHIATDLVLDEINRRNT